jgi:hypothetical protein
MSYKAQMYGGGESSGGIVPAKRSNEGQGGPQEIVEGRPPAKENSDQSDPHRTQCRTSGPPYGWDGCAKRRSFRCHDPRWEPCALGALARFCAGGAG